MYVYNIMNYVSLTIYNPTYGVFVEFLLLYNEIANNNTSLYGNL